MAYIKSALFLIFIIASSGIFYAQSATQTAVRFLQENSVKYNLTVQDVSNYIISDNYVSKHNGVTHVYFKQTHNDIEVYNGIFNVNIMPDNRVIHAGNRFVSDLSNRVNTISPSLSAEDAIRKALVHFNISNGNDELILVEDLGEKEKIYSGDGFSSEQVPVKLVYQLMPDRSVKLAWNVVIYTLDAQNGYNARVDAGTGEILDVFNHVLHCDFGAPDQCKVHDHKHANQIPFINGHTSQFKVGGANSYNVFPLFVESPNHGTNVIVTDPADPTASPYGWHDTDGVAGHEYTITRGNNVHAYHDIFNNNASNGDEPDGGSTLDFNFPYNLPANTPYTYVPGAVTNLFYWCNLMHDIWYGYGFDETSGNFQVNNYGNGGLDGDYIRAEAMDGSGTNNANFSSGADGSTARIQMYLWTSDALPGSGGAQSLVVNAPATVAGNYPMVPASFGGSLPLPAFTADVVEVIDPVAPASDGCDGITNGMAISGKIALIDRGSCEFGVKCLDAEGEGAIAVIMCNNVTTAPISMGAGAVGAQVTIPCVMISQADCATIRVALTQGLNASIGFVPGQIPTPGPSGVTGDLDNGIIAHEYGHGVSIRMTGGPSTGSCLGSAEQAGEGWSDWFGLILATDQTRTANERRGIGTYALGQPTTGDGIRTYPYSRDMAINPHTYGDVPNSAIPHGVGSIWCAAIWDLYWNMIDQDGFDPDIYNGTGGNNKAMQLVMDGIKFQACNPSFIDSRDGVLAADVANYNGANECLIWSTFARRGIGHAATPGGNEAFDLAPSCLATLKIEKTAVEVAEAGSIMTYTFNVINDIAITQTNVMIVDTLPPGVTFVAGSGSCSGTTISGNIVTIPVGNMQTATSLTCSFDVEIALTPVTTVIFEDDMEAGGANWESTAGAGATLWVLNNANPNSGSMAWFAEDVATTSDQYLDTDSPITISGTLPALSFMHWYDTEATWDGGVVEFSIDNGATWIDMGPYMSKNGYNSKIQTNQASPISDRDAFSGNSGAYINTVIDLSGWNGATGIFRFRLGTDGAVAGNGWYIDDIKLVDLYTVTNSACVRTDQNNFACSSVTTTIEADVSTSNQEIEPLSGVKVFPNPTDNILNVEFRETLNNVTFEVISVDGKVLSEKSIDQTNNVQTIDVSGLIPGIYMLNITSDQGKVLQKFIVE